MKKNQGRVLNLCILAHNYQKAISSLKSIVKKRKSILLNRYLLGFLIYAYSPATAQNEPKKIIDSVIRQLNHYNLKCQDTCLADSSKVKLQNTLAWEIHRHKTDSAILLTRQSLKISEKINWPFGIAQSYSHLAAFYQIRGDNNKAIQYAFTAIDLWNKMLLTFKDDPRLLQSLAASSGNLATVYLKTGLYNESLKIFVEIDRIFVNLKLTNKHALTLTNIAIVYLRLNNFNTSIDYSKKALPIWEVLNSPLGILQTCTNLGIGYKEVKNYDQSLIYLFRALDTAQKRNSRLDIAKVHSNISDTYAAMRDYVKALEFANSAWVNDSLENNKEGMAIRQQNQAAIYIEQKNYDKAEELLQSSYKTGLNIKNIDIQKGACQVFRKLYEKTDRYRDAYQYFQKEQAIDDSIFNNNKIAEFTRIEANYAFSKQRDSARAEQDKQLALAAAETKKQKLARNFTIAAALFLLLFSALVFIIYKRKRDAEQKQKETALSLQVAETEMKALRSQMNPHFIFNAMRSIRVLLENHQLVKAATYLSKFASLLRAVLENSQHSTVFIQKDKEALELYMELESLQLTYPLTYSYKIAEPIEAEGNTIPPLILQPIVENAILHGLKDKPAPGHIDITISEKEGVLYVVVEDNGIGRKNGKVTTNYPLIKSESLGIKLTEDRLKILNKLNDIEAGFYITDLFTKDKEPAGTRVELYLPLSYD